MKKKYNKTIDKSLIGILFSGQLHAFNKIIMQSVVAYEPVKVVFPPQIV